jgi:ubiquinone/menaquinone biosynthesis C-methylase UbiE
MHVRDAEAAEGAAIAAVVDLAGNRVIEVGCGGGRLTRFAAARAKHVFAFDPNREAVASARQALSAAGFRNVEFAVHDAHALDLARRRFDLALCGWSL